MAARLHFVTVLSCLSLMSVASQTCSSGSPESCTSDSSEALSMLQKKSSEALSMLQKKSGKKYIAGVKRYSQFGQDKWLADLFGEEFKGFYLDIGAHDGVILSNTQALDERGWTGVCVEPLPTGFEKRTCKLYKEVLTDVTGEQVTFQDCTIRGTDGGDGGLSGISGLGAYDDTGARDGCYPVTFKTTRTDHFMGKVSSIPKIIDYLSLDVEGAEEKIMSRFPWKQHCVKAFTVERPTIAVEALLRKHDCTLDAYLGEDHAYTCKCEEKEEAETEKAIPH